MAERMLTLQLTEGARVALSSLGDDDRRQVLAWFDHLKNWPNDEFVRAHSRPLASQAGVQVLRTNSDFAIFFRLAGDTVTVQSIFREDALRALEAAGRAR